MKTITNKLILRILALIMGFCFPALTGFSQKDALSADRFHLGDAVEKFHDWGDKMMKDLDRPSAHSETHEQHEKPDLNIPHEHDFNLPTTHKDPPSVYDKAKDLIHGITDKSPCLPDIRKDNIGIKCDWQWGGPKPSEQKESRQVGKSGYNFHSAGAPPPMDNLPPGSLKSF